MSTPVRYQMPPPDYADPKVYIIGATLVFKEHSDPQVPSKFRPGDILTVDTYGLHEADGILVYGTLGTDMVWPDEVEFLHDVWAFNPNYNEPLCL